MEVIEEIRKEEWYHDQIVEQRSFEAHEPEFGAPLNHLCVVLVTYRQATQETSRRLFLAISRRG